MNMNHLKKRTRILLENPYALFKYFNFSKTQCIIPNEPFLKLMVRASLGYRLNLTDPQTFNEKLQWLKLYDHKPIYTRMVDKYEVKSFISEKVGKEYVVPTYGIWDKFDRIDFSSLPNQFVLKTTHDCGGVAICKDKATFNYMATKSDFEKRLRNNFFWRGREWPYKNVKPRILAEKYLNFNTQGSPFTYNCGDEPAVYDYKIMCFNGEPYCCLVCMGRNSIEGLHENFYDLNWQLLPFRRSNPQYLGDVKKPRFYDDMLRISRILSEQTSFLRVDFFENEDCLYVGELTFFPANGFEKFIPEEWDYRLGSLIKLKKNE